MRRTFYTGAIILAIHTLLGGALAAQVDPTTEPTISLPDGLTYAGAFLYPPDLPGPGGWSDPNNGSWYTWGYTSGVIAYDAVRTGILGCGIYCNRVGEFSIPTASMTTSVSALPRAVLMQQLTDVLGGRLGNIGFGNDAIGGILPISPTQTIVSGFAIYDANAQATTSHFTANTDVTSVSASGPVSVTGSMGGAGWTGGAMIAVPAEFQPLLGGVKYLTGQCCLNIIGRTSWGPTLTEFDPSQVVAGVAQTGKTLVGYNQAHPTLGTWGNGTGSGAGPVSLDFGEGSSPTAWVWVKGTRTLLAFERSGLGPQCYGEGTPNASLAGTTAPDGQAYCFDNAQGGTAKGGHAAPYGYRVLAFDALDLVAVHNGTKSPWQVVPYATAALSLPFPSLNATFGGATQDDTGRIYVSDLYVSGTTAAIREFTTSMTTTAPPPPPPPPSQQSLTASITPKALTATVTVPDKKYDGTTAAPGASCVLSGVVAGDVVTCTAVGTFANKNVGSRQVSVTITIGGADAGNYTPPASPVTVVANITKKSVSLSGVTAQAKVYDGTLTANCSGGAIVGAVPGDDVTVGAPACAFTDKAVGQNKPVTVTQSTALGGVDAGNYVVGGTL